MTPQELEERLRQFGTDWPIPSVGDAVMMSIESQRVPPPRRASWLRRRAPALAGAAAMLAVAVGAVWLFVLAAPTTLQAQIQQSLKKSRTAQIVFSAPDDKGVRHWGEIWYERNRGFRAESPDEIILDDGKQQWTWNPGTKASERVIARRASRNAAGIIAGMFQLGDAPAAMTRQRAPEHDRKIDGRACRGFIVTPPALKAVQDNGSDSLPDPHHPLRFVVLIDSDERIVHLQVQQQVDGRWQAGREVSLSYDVKIPAEKLAVKLPAGRVIDADRALEERFPLDKALAQVEADGLLFAIHELQRGADEMFYVVSSVRGTPKYLKKHPPRRRRVSLNLTIVDVADQLPAAATDMKCSRAVLATAEANGVQYLWWLAVRRRYFTVEDGKRVPHSESASLELSPGNVRVPLQAIRRSSPWGWVRAEVDVSVAVDQKAQCLADLAARTRRDTLLIQQAPGTMVHLCGWVKDGEIHRGPPDQLTDSSFAKQVSRQLEWLHSHDEVHRP